MLCLAIESTAHTFACSVISSKGKILSDVRDMYQSNTHGIIPSEAAQHHEKLYHQIIKKAIEESKIEKFDLLAYSRGPGLSPSLKVGLKAAKEYSEDLKIPLIGVNHCCSHLSSAHLFTEVKDPIYIFVSGANTQIIALEGGRFRLLGEALSIALGNALDKFGREIGLGFPAGPKIEELAKTGKYIELPYVVKGMDIELSGIVTSAISKFKKRTKKEDLCFSIQETLFSMLTEVTERALAHTGKTEAVIIGGVAANKRLSEMLSIMCKERNAKFYSVPLKYSGDNSVMIGYQGILEYLAGNRTKNPDIHPYERTDSINVNWKY
ncbi:tRNA (adenosine(37)-N6)-threonylcarbamoyltransferase complex transferase subunit TsaD [Candidatus Woesearchaeota archaeon]|nr:tRNA (adenosine(37)-N6)-threonylcarbamoyltransferase complex transferase subunit TsaD [Candidatus Woesearchaeota archaeon]